MRDDELSIDLLHDLVPAAQEQDLLEGLVRDRRLQEELQERLREHEFVHRLLMPISDPDVALDEATVPNPDAVEPDDQPAETRCDAAADEEPDQHRCSLARATAMLEHFLGAPTEEL